jgi:hypothetical protein
MELKLTSSAFGDGAAIPRDHTCEGADESPPLAWEGLPAGTQSLVLIVRRRAAARNEAGAQRLEARGLSGTVSAHRPSSLLPQAVRARRGAS